MSEPGCGCYMADLPDLLLFSSPSLRSLPHTWRRKRPIGMASLPPSRFEVAGVNSIIIITAVIQFSELPCVFFASAGRRDGEGDRVTLDLSRLSLPYNIPWSVTAAAVDRYRRRREEGGSSDFPLRCRRSLSSLLFSSNLSLPFCRLASHHHANSINNNSRADSLGQSRS